MTDVTIRRMTRGDVPTVADLEAEIYPQPWSQRVFYDELAMDSRRYMCALVDGRIVGYGGLLLIEDDAHITTVAVAPAARGHLIGTRLMLSLIDRSLDFGARHLTLEVRMSNEPARRLYERFGFRSVGRRKNYYRDEDALVMWATDIDADEYGERLDEVRATLGEET